jgi:predicted RNase H-like nuclease (RuvC/YqgF family)
MDKYAIKETYKYTNKADTWIKPPDMEIVVLSGQISIRDSKIKDLEEEIREKDARIKCLEKELENVYALT